MDDDKGRKSNEKKKTPTLATITTAAIITMAVLFTGSLGAVVTTSSYAQQEEEAPTTMTEEEAAVDAITLNDTGEGQLPEEAAVADPEVQIQEEPTQGNAILVEQVFSTLEECYAVLDSLGMVLVKTDLNQTEAEGTVETEAEDIAAEIEIPPQIESDIDELQEAVAENNTEVGAALEENLNATEVVEGIVEDAILEEVLDNEVTADGENVGEAIDEIIQAGAEEVLNGTTTPEEAVENVEGNLTEILGEIDITPEDIEQASEVVSNENATGEAIAPVTPGGEELEGAGAGAEPSEVAGNETGAIVDIALEEELGEIIPDVAEASGTDEETVRQLLQRALTLLG